MGWNSFWRSIRIFIRRHFHEIFMLWMYENWQQISWKYKSLTNENAPLERISKFCKRQHKLPFTVNIVLLLCHTVLWNVYEFKFKELAFNWKVCMYNVYSNLDQLTVFTKIQQNWAYCRSLKKIESFPKQKREKFLLVDWLIDWVIFCPLFFQM